MADRQQSLDDLRQECERLSARVAQLEAAAKPPIAPSESEERLRAIVQGAPLVLWCTDADGRFTLSDGKGLASLGLKPGEVVGESVFDVYADVPEIIEAHRRALAGESVDSIVHVGELAFDARSGPLRGQDGDVVGVIGVATDITQRVRAEQRLHEEVRRQKALLEQGWDVIVMLDPGGTITFASDSTTHMLGFRPDETVGRSVAEFVHPDDVVVVRDAIQGIIDRPVGPGTIQARVAHRDGSHRWMEIRGSNFLDDDAMKAIVVNCRDISDRKATEEELVRLERLRALGEMSAGVSHNLNNILTGVLAPAEMLKLRARDPDDLVDIDDILSSATRARDLVSRLHRAVRWEAEALQPVDLDQVIRDAVRVTRPRWRDEPQARGVSVDVAMSLGAHDRIRGTQAELQDMIINLVFNAIDAMPDGGTIDIETGRSSGGVRLTVSDTGNGMDEATRKRVFEPFFTTKPEVGTGLGLSIVFGTINRWGGTVDVDSAPGTGTRFTFELPIWKEADVSGAPEVASD